MTRQQPITIFPSAPDPQPAGTITIKQLAANIRSGFWADTIGPLREALARSEDEYKARKKYLPCVAPGGQFSYRNVDGLTRHSGLCVVDFDELTRAEAEAGRDLAAGSPHCLLAFISPSELGYKAIVRVALETGEALDGDTHPAAWAAARDHLRAITGHAVDKSGRDVSRLCFVSHDPDARYQPGAVALVVDPQVELEQSPLPSVSSDSARRCVRTQRPAGREHVRNPVAYAEAALDDAARNVAGAPKDSRHAELLAAARAIGGFCNATVDGVTLELLTPDEVIGGLSAALVQAGKTIGEGMRTARDGVAYGMAQPRVLSTDAVTLCHPDPLSDESYTITRPLNLSGLTFGPQGITRDKDSRLKDLRLHFRRVMRGLGTDQTWACGRVGMLAKPGKVKLFRMWCGNTACRNCGAERRARWACHLIALFRRSMYLTIQPEAEWDSRRMPAHCRWVWLLIGDGQRAILSSSPIGPDSRRINEEHQEAEVVTLLEVVRLGLAPRQRGFGASLGCGLTSDQPKTDSKSEWRFLGICRAARSVEQAAGVAVAIGGRVTARHKAFEQRGCGEADAVPLFSAEIDMRRASVDVLGVRLGCEMPGGGHAAAA